MWYLYLWITTPHNTPQNQLLICVAHTFQITSPLLSELTMRFRHYCVFISLRKVIVQPRVQTHTATNKVTIILPRIFRMAFPVLSEFWTIKSEIRCTESCRPQDCYTLSVRWLNRPVSRLPQCTCPTSQNTQFRTEMCTSLFWIVYCGDGTGALRDLWHRFPKVTDSLLCIRAVRTVRKKLVKESMSATHCSTHRPAGLQTLRTDRSSRKWLMELAAER